MKYLTRTIWILSIISLLTDIASEMLYPVMPIYLKSIGFSIWLIGILEGVAEATAGLSKGYFGKLSDHVGRRAPFVRLGYTLSALSKPMMALTVYPLWIFLARTVDRAGKGIRTGARDAMLSDEATPATKGRVFGFHRSMDTLGAVIGPALALLYLYFYPANYRILFLLAFFPGVLAIACTLLLKDKEQPKTGNSTRTSFFSFLRYWNTSPVIYRRLVAGLLVFTLCNSSDVFLLLKMKQEGLSDTATIGVYIFYNMIYAIASFPLGVLADQIGLKKIFVAGLLLFAIVYAGIAAAGGWYWYGLLFFLYGLYAAATEGISKAWISNITSKKDTATAIGTYTAFQSVCTMLASSLTGLLWFKFGAGSALLTTAAIAFMVVIYILITVPAPKNFNTDKALR
ncbi:MFS-type transporter involved in bile tolerance (Atg22 family) [Chitinophaga polysaccharea]|uniref:MFS-type transporter involved in bile tolerance (Atg22 family) n=1 Tax=Chitinophaga polysaccharea TaxID=1293035 RepID=A0A561PM59_9BACT|nr:MFS transporter [Chitinophaga polysaccharea]TWF39212.1 MFS-type transporter involved in bile tolerance (Atg22 family) [Chitinophaga polysaccharea]